MNILLIEPDQQLGSIYSKALEQAGYEIRWERNAQDAIVAADEFTPDAVVIELQLARHNGVEFLYEFRSYPDWQTVPIVLNTSVATLPASKNLLEQLGIKAVHYKPHTSLAQLLRSIEGVLLPLSA